MEHIPIASGPPLILPEFSLRSRREQPIRDLFNARQYDHWNSDGPTPSQNSYGTSNPTTPENIPAGPIYEHFSNAGLNLLEVPGDHLPEPD